jgi:hypothetical protein
MKKTVLISIIIFWFINISAQTKIYKETSTYSGDILCNLSYGKVFKKLLHIVAILFAILLETKYKKEHHHIVAM